MTDRNGKEIKIGDKAVLIGRGHDDLEGCIGEVRDMKDDWGKFPDTSRAKGEPRARVTDGPEGNPNWSAWCKPDEIAVV